MKPLIVANWKMNPQNLKEAKLLFNLVKKGVKKARHGRSQRTEVVICPPFVYLTFLLNLKPFDALNPVRFALQLSNGVILKLGAQDCFWEEKGAYTGEISSLMLKNLGVKYVIVGHSERRRHFQETDEIINKKIKAVLKTKLKPILCIDNISQLKKGLKGSKKEQFILAYEPLFAIGTGTACSLERAKEMKNKIQKILGKNIKVLYGGSINSQNAVGYIKEAGFSGLLIGGASLNAKEFIKIVSEIDLISKKR